GSGASFYFWTVRNLTAPSLIAEIQMIIRVYFLSDSNSYPFLVFVHLLFFQGWLKVNFKRLSF
ncbi:hypothetical protein, partial [Ileibacterium valens]|uniref:hypothetical protein n=1 Tax=Ileibacterium valens TaxID=1862668 RepID=UPI00272CE687